MIETICSLPNEFVMGLASFAGAAIYAGFSIYRKKLISASVLVKMKINRAG